MEHLRRAIKQFAGKGILVVGDIMLDQYTYGEVTRMSPEAPVPILHKLEENFVLGGAANVANNAAALGARVTLCGFVGDDSRKTKILELLKKNRISAAGVLDFTTRPTILKHRLVAAGHQLLRVDDEVVKSLDTDEEDRLITTVKRLLPACEAIIFSDYAKGALSERAVAEIIKLGKKGHKLIVADLKPSNKKIFYGVDVITPNVKEGMEMTGSITLEEIGPQLVKDFNASVVLTMGENGIYVFEKAKPAKHLPSRKVKVFDVSGAGDTVVAVVALGMVCDLNLAEAAHLGNLAGEIVVQKFGTATLSAEELLSALVSHHDVSAVEVVPKVWGFEKWLENNDKYCSKLLSLNKGYQCSLHSHKVKDEMFLITKGHVRLELGDKVLHLRENNYIRIPPGTVHRFTGMENSEILEISTHHEEADTNRFEESKKINLGDYEKV
jgi:rfaE bifunctional protein kinase chain/domain